MNMKQTAYALTLGILLTACAHADTIYNITFTDLENSPTFSNATGTFTTNAADQVTSFNVSFQVLKAYSFEAASGFPGEVITFNGIASSSDPGGLPTLYIPATGYFGDSYVTYNYSFTLKETQAGNPSNGVNLGIAGGDSALGRIYSLDAVSNQTFFSPIDTGTYSVTTPEPGCLGLMLTGSAFVLLGLVYWRSVAKRCIAPHHNIFTS